MWASLIGLVDSTRLAFDTMSQYTDQYMQIWHSHNVVLDGREPISPYPCARLPGRKTCSWKHSTIFSRVRLAQVVNPPLTCHQDAMPAPKIQPVYEAENCHCWRSSRQLRIAASRQSSCADVPISRSLKSLRDSLTPPMSVITLWTTPLSVVGGHHVPRHYSL
jgi:hypothetical protein